MESTGMLDAMRRVELLAKSFTADLPYTAPEVLEAVYWNRVAVVMNLLDPEGRCIAAAR